MPVRWLAIVLLCLLPAALAREAGRLGEGRFAAGHSPATTSPATRQTVYSHGDPTVYEQLMLELINRARLDPAGEAARLGIGLNDDLAPGTISDAPKPPLAFHPALLAAARGHSQWMLDSDTFDHIDDHGTDGGMRMQAAGYSFSGSWSWGENIGWQGSSGPIDLEYLTNFVHQKLFKSPGHRPNMCNPAFEEIGIGSLDGLFFHKGREYNTGMFTQNYARSAATPGPLVVGVVFNDANGNAFYDIGEGLAGVTVSVEEGDWQTVTSTSGGFALPYAGSSGTMRVVFAGAPLPQPVAIDLPRTGQNVTCDLNFAHMPASHMVVLAVAPENAGEVAGGGTVFHGNQASVAATAAEGYRFRDWTENGMIVATTAVYEFTVVGDRHLTANFSRLAHTVVFSPGNHGILPGGDPDVMLEIFHGEPANPPQAIPHAGWAFDGWQPPLPAMIIEPWTTTVRYRDIEPPVIVVEPAGIVLALGDPPPNVLDGVSAQDNADGDISHLVQSEGTVDTDVPGVHIVSYNVTDEAGNPASGQQRRYSVDLQKDWTLALQIAGAQPETLILGMANYATEAFDQGIDVATDSAGQPGSAWLAGADFSLDYREDYRAVADEADYLLVVHAGETADVVVSWDASALPAERHLSLWEVDDSPDVRNGPGDLPPVGDTAIDMAKVDLLTVAANTARVFVIRYAPDATFDWGLQAGWNLKSLPLQAHDPSLPTIFAGDRNQRAGGSPIWRWTGHRYAIADTIVPLHGYLIFSANPRVTLVRGRPANQAAIELKSGWNLVAVESRRAVPQDPAIVGPCRRWDATRRVYQTTLEMKPGSAYWLKTHADLSFPLHALPDQRP